MFKTIIVERLSYYFSRSPKYLDPFDQISSILCKKRDSELNVLPFYIIVNKMDVISVVSSLFYTKTFIKYFKLVNSLYSVITLERFNKLLLFLT